MTGRRLGLAAHAGVLALAACLPFETVDAALRLGGLRFTSVEIVLALALALSGLALVANPARRAAARAAVPTHWIALLGAFAIAVVVSALAAPAFEGTALRAAARTWAGLAVVGAVVVAAPTRREVGRVAGALVAGALVAAAIGLAEVLSDDRFEWLRHFRVVETFVGSLRRLSATFNQANVAAMFLEATIPLLAALVWLAWRRGRTFAAAVGLVALVALVEALMLTYSRAGIVSLVVSNVVVATLVLVGARRETSRVAAPGAVVVLLAVAALAFTLAARPAAREGLRHESTVSSYRAETDPTAPAPIPRSTLWRAAWELGRERPLLGTGLDTFRLSYGSVLDDGRRWDTRFHSNSLYVETLVSLGIVGGAVFVAWLVLLFLDVCRTLVRDADLWRAAVATGLVAFLAHGVLDYFLLFSSTGLLFWLLCGLWLVVRRPVSP